MKLNCQLNNEGAFGAAHGGKPLALRRDLYFSFLPEAQRQEVFFETRLPASHKAYRHVQRRSRLRETNLADE